MSQDALENFEVKRKALAEVCRDGGLSKDAVRDFFIAAIHASAMNSLPVLP